MPFDSDEVNTGNSLQLSSLNSDGAAASNGKSSASPKKKLTKKKSAGFDNPLYFDAKVTITT